MRIVATLFIVSFLSVGCERIFIEPANGYTTQSLYDQLWETVDGKYTYFDYKNIDWDAAYERHVGRIQPTMSEDSLFDVLGDLLFELQDGHVNLSAGFNRSRNWTWFEDFPSNYNANFVERVYLDRDYFFTGALIHRVIREDVGYLRYSSFANPISAQQMDFVLEKMENTKGLIIDVRDNGGGSVGNVATIMSRFITEDVQVGKERYRNGGRNDFTEPEIITLEASNRVTYLKPIVVLTNRSCYSACNLFAAYMSQLPQVTLIGDQTGGGGGVPISSELDNGWQFRYSGSRLQLMDDTDIENGIPVDISVSTGPAEELEGIDAIIEQAIEVLK